MLKTRLRQRVLELMVMESKMILIRYVTLLKIQKMNLPKLKEGYHQKCNNMFVRLEFRLKIKARARFHNNFLVQKIYHQKFTLKCIKISICIMNSNEKRHFRFCKKPVQSISKIISHDTLPFSFFFNVRPLISFYYLSACSDKQKFLSFQFNKINIDFLLINFT